MDAAQHHSSKYNIHEIKLKQSTGAAIQQLLNMSSHIYIDGDSTRDYLLIDAREAKSLSIRLLAHELRALSQRDNLPCIAIVTDSSTITDETSRLIATVMQRNRIEFFTDIDKAYLWLKLEMRR